MKSKTDLPPSRTAEQFVVRFPDGMRDKIAELAKKNNRSMNAEIVQRLEWALSILSAPEVKAINPDLSGDIPWGMRQDISELANKAGVPFEEMLARIFTAGLNPSAPQVLYMPILPGATMQDLRATMEIAKDFVRPDAAIVAEKVAYNIPPTK